MSAHGENAVPRVVFYNQRPTLCGSLSVDGIELGSPVRRRRSDSNRQELSREYLAVVQQEASAGSSVRNALPSRYERLSVAGSTLYESIHQVEGWLCSDLESRSSQAFEDGDWWTGKVSLYHVVKKGICAQEDVPIVDGSNTSMLYPSATSEVAGPAASTATSWPNPWHLLRLASHDQHRPSEGANVGCEAPQNASVPDPSSTRSFIQSGESMYLCFLALFLIHYMYLLVRVTKQTSVDRHSRSRGVSSSLRTIAEECGDDLTSCEEDEEHVLQQIESLYQEDIVVVQPKRRLDAIPDVVDCYLKDDEEEIVDDLVGLELCIRLRAPSAKKSMKSERPPSVAALSGSALSLLEGDCETLSISSSLSLESVFSNDSDDETECDVNPFGAYSFDMNGDISI